MVKTPAPGVRPFTVQEKVSGFEFALAPVAVKLSEFGKATELPVAAGVCEAQVGGVFLFTVQVRVAVLVPFESVATNVLAPAFKADDKRFCVADVEPRL